VTESPLTPVLRGLRETRWDDLELVAHWKRFLGAPQAYLRHLSDD